MIKRHYISEEEVAEIEKARKMYNDKTIDKWLEVLLLHALGKTREEISVKTGFKKQYITELVGEYRRERKIEESVHKYIVILYNGINKRNRGAFTMPNCKNCKSCKAIKIGNVN